MISWRPVRSLALAVASASLLASTQTCAPAIQRQPEG
jgi:hypothetical protein